MNSTVTHPASKLILTYFDTVGSQRMTTAVLDIAHKIPPGIALRHLQARRKRNKGVKNQNQPIDDQLRQGSTDLVRGKIKDFLYSGRLQNWWIDGQEWIGKPEFNPTPASSRLKELRHALDDLLDKEGHAPTCPWRPYHVAATSIFCPKEPHD